MKLLVQLACLVVFALSLASHLGSLHPVCETLAHFKFQFLLLLAFASILQIVFRRRGMLLLSLACLTPVIVQVAPWYLAPKTPVLMEPAAQAARKQAGFKILFANVLFSNHQSQSLANLIRQQAPELVVLQEANMDLVQVMKEFEAVLPYHFRARNLPYGLAVWSKYPISQPRFELLADQDLPSLRGQFQIGGKVLNMFTTHLTSPVREPVRVRDRQLQVLANYLNQHPEIDLVLGDFNISMWSPAYAQFEKATGLNNCRKGFGVLSSWPSKLPEWARIPIDQCFSRQAYQIKKIQLGPNIGSDHMPLIIEMIL